MTDPFETQLSVSEIFGPTIQGEGASQGRAVVFLRLGLCNLDCSWCDTPYTWDWTGKNGKIYIKENELNKWTIRDILDRLSDAAGPFVDRLVISGGEPLLQQKRLAHLVKEWDGPVEIETNGTIIPSETLVEEGVQFNCSPKLFNSGIKYEDRIIPEVLYEIGQAFSFFKFVVDTEEDIREVDAIMDLVLNIHDQSRIFLMPQGIDSTTIKSKLPWVMTQAAKRGWSVSPRLHTLAFEQKRGI
jgi:7-carboxy-7-deazaguanine synthase